MARHKFEPTAEHRLIVRNCKAAGMKDEQIRQMIRNPSERGQPPISIQTYRNVFAEELKTAKADLNSQALSVIFTGLTNADADFRFRCANKVLQLCSKGVYEKKFTLDYKKSPEQQINQVLEALNEKQITPFEADSYINGIKATIDSREVNESEKTITFSVDAETAEVIKGAFTK